MNPTDATTPGPLPRYRSPPVVEALVGVHFQPLAKWGVQHFGLFWDRLRQTLPVFETRTPLGAQIEKFGQPDAPKAQVLELMEAAELRGWMGSADGTRLVQVQRDWFLYNWREGEQRQQYPHYEEIRTQFEQRWKEFQIFSAEHQLGEPVPLQCEVTYVNHIPKGDGWESPKDWHRIFKLLANTEKGTFLPDPESGRFAWNYVIPGNRGRLRVSVTHVVRASDGLPMCSVNLTARGKPESNSTDGILKWLDLGREWVVKGFTEITTKEMHTLWGRYQ